MPKGGGKYDDACTLARVATGGRAVVLIVLGGDLGSGFSVHADEAHIALPLPALLRQVADQIEADIEKG